MFTTQFQAWVRRLALRAAARARSLPVTPNQLTITGLLVTLCAAGLIAFDHPFYAGLVLLFAGVFDIFDGALARASGRSYNYGAFLDSTTDRLSEAAVMVGLVVYFQRHQVFLGPVLVVLATAGSLLVSYVRARAQSLGFTCEGGLLARPERVLLTVIGLLFTPLNGAVLLAVIGLLAVFSNLTALQRMWIVWRQSRALLALAAADSTPPDAPAVAPPAQSQVEPRAVDREVRPGPEPAGG
ncbi:MAG: CDP-diacylglycerol---glycerol-3-phosphate 3-phosphatidyltransferase [Chloroflexota bacterium]|nr:CDP-diacylglycerol---glycerol-3-phosphate 3-phosphatidyltransferase [Chloroflexota bacterium]